jgi:hypothetical protein
MAVRRPSSAWCNREIALRERQDQRRIISNWVRCAVCDRTRIPRKQYREQGRVCAECKERHKNTPPGQRVDLDRMVARRKDDDATAK